MARKIERAALPALLYLCTRASVIVRLRLPVHPVRNARRSIPPVSGPPQDHASLGLHVHPPLALVKTPPSRRGSRAPRDWTLREVTEGRRVPPPLPVMSHARIRIRISSSVGARFVSHDHGGEALVSFRFHPQLSPPLPFRQRPGYPASITFHIRSRLFMLFL
ncbi:hypothetical protein K438DRAFT_2002590 [Mycena galopus ATCC 62051]|nr:hypothetical protein K438DRAFT_2002590 [Mycena galopus ATCC 62051]